MHDFQEFHPTEPSTRESAPLRLDEKREAAPSTPMAPQAPSHAPIHEFPVASTSMRKSARARSLPETPSRETATPEARASTRESARAMSPPAKPSRESGERAAPLTRASAIDATPSQPSPKGGRKATLRTRVSATVATPSVKIPDDVAAPRSLKRAEDITPIIGADALQETRASATLDTHPQSSPATGRRAFAETRESAKARTPADTSPARERAAIVSTRENARVRTPPDTFVSRWGENSYACEQIKALVRTRQTWLQAKNRLVLHAKALCRSACAGDKKLGADLFNRIRKGAHSELSPLIAPFMSDIAQWEARIAPIETEILRIFAQTPIAGHVEATRGLGAMSVATLVGMSADFSTIPTVDMLWARFGLHVSMDGMERGPLIDPGRANRFPRRAAAFVVGSGLMKAGNPRFRAIYDREKAKALGKGWKKARAHNHAMRVGTKDALEQMWKAWRREVAQ